MAILTKDEAQTILKKVLSYSTADECTVSLNGSESGNIRYALNAISTSGDISTLSLGVNSTFGKKTGSASINEFDDESLRKVVKRAEELAQLAPDNPEHMPLPGPLDYKEPISFSQSTASVTPDLRAEAVAKSINAAKEAKLQAAGFLENTTGFNAVMNSKGFFGYNKDTDVVFTITTRNEQGTGSGYAARGFNDFSKLDTLSATKIAAQKANGSVGARSIEPGKYTVILEPVAATYMLGNMFRALDARSADEGRSFMSKPGGGNRIGEKLFDDKVTIYSDPMNQELPSNTWSGEGLELKKTYWIDKGVVKNLGYSRYWAQQKGVQPLPGPGGFGGGGGRGGGGGGGGSINIIMEGGNQSVEDMIKTTERGILVSRLWYIRMVDQQTLLLTGLTRDGTFYIEDGKIKYPVMNFRFNESPVIMLNNVEALGKPERSVDVESYRSFLIPPMKIRDFTFTSTSEAV